MKLDTDEKGEIVLKEIYSGVKLETKDKEYMGICMRDSGFEFNYIGTWYSAKEGIISKGKEYITHSIFTKDDLQTIKTDILHIYDKVSLNEIETHKRNLILNKIRELL